MFDSNTIINSLFSHFLVFASHSILDKKSLLLLFLARTQARARSFAHKLFSHLSFVLILVIFRRSFAFAFCFVLQLCSFSLLARDICKIPYRDRERESMVEYILKAIRLFHITNILHFRIFCFIMWVSECVRVYGMDTYIYYIIPEIGNTKMKKGRQNECFCRQNR